MRLASRHREALWQLVRARGIPAQLCVVRGDEVVFDRSYRTADDALFWAFSAGKPLTSVLVWRLVGRGLVDPDAPMAHYWPELVGGHKEQVTVRHVLQHRSGLPTAGSLLGDVLAMTDWDASVARLEHAHCRFPPGTAPAYQFLTYGFLLGELVQRVSGLPFAQVLHDEVLVPAGLADTYAALDRDLADRAQPMQMRRSGTVVAGWINRPAVRTAVIPAGGISLTARDLASFYAHLLGHGGPLLEDDLLAEAVRPTTETELDRFARLHIRWGQGFQLGGPRPGRLPIPLGDTSGPRAFGHNGSHVCLGWADPDLDLAVGYVTAGMVRPDLDLAHMARISDTILDLVRSSQ